MSTRRVCGPAQAWPRLLRGQSPSVPAGGPSEHEHEALSERVFARVDLVRIGLDRRHVIPLDLHGILDHVQGGGGGRDIDNTYLHRCVHVAGYC